MTPDEELQRRFRVISEGVAHVHGKDLAFSAACAAWLMAIERVIGHHLEQVRDANADSVREEVVVESKAEVREILMSFHKEICDHFGIDRLEAAKLSHHWDQLLSDLFKGKM